jgi:hypothetical protein
MKDFCLIYVALVSEADKFAEADLAACHVVKNCNSKGSALCHHGYVSPHGAGVATTSSPVVKTFVSGKNSMSTPVFES